MSGEEKQADEQTSPAKVEKNEIIEEAEKVSVNGSADAKMEDIKETAIDSEKTEAVACDEKKGEEAKDNEETEKSDSDKDKPDVEEKEKQASDGDKVEEMEVDKKEEEEKVESGSADDKEESVDTKEEKEDDDDNGSDEDLPPGLLERPIEIIREKRERKKTTRFTYDDTPASTEKKKFEVPEGRGTKLGEHPRVEWQLQRNKSEDLKIIHKLFFGSFGDAHSCKKNIRNFSGFPFEKDSPEFEKKEDYISRFTLDNLKWALTVCDVEYKKGLKENLIDAFLDWCLCPKPSGKDLPTKKKKEKSTKRRSKKPAQTNNTSIASDDESSSEEISDEESEETPKKKSKPRKSQTPKTAEKKTKRKSSNGSSKKAAKIKIASPKKYSDSSDSDDSDAPLQKKKKPSAPTNAQIRKSIEKILKGANLEVITMKSVRMKIYSQYPDFDLSDRKDFIKETVKKIIS